MSETHGRVLNWKKGPEDSRDFRSLRHLTAPPTLPESFELDKQIPIYDQEDLGSCTSNSGCACYRFESAQVVGNFDFNPSRLFLYYNTRVLEGSVNEDAGAYIRDVFKALNKWGLAKESFFPYHTQDFAKKPTDAAYSDGLNNLVISYAAVQQSESVIKQTLLSGAAISFGFTVYSSFMGNWHSSTGVMPIPKKSEQILGGHAVTIIGWSDAKKAFLIQNSWGTSWGQSGKFWMPYSFLLDGNMCDDFWCIESIQIKGVDPVDPNPPTPPISIDWLTVSKVLFKTSKELWAVKKSTLVRLGTALGLTMNEKKSFNYNYLIVKEKLGL